MDELLFERSKETFSYGIIPAVTHSSDIGFIGQLEIVLEHAGFKTPYHVKMLRSNSLPKNLIFTDIESQIEYSESVLDLLRWCAGLSLKQGTKITWLLRLMSSDAHLVLDRILNSAEISQAGWWSEQMDRQTWRYSIFPSALVKGSKFNTRLYKTFNSEASARE
jgi:hypothetical protein